MAGATANREPYNNLKSLICALASIPFYCHHTRMGRDITELADKRFTRGELKDLQMKICGGWSARTRVLEAAGHYTGRRKTLQFIGQYAIEQLDAMLDYTDTTADGEAARRHAEGELHKALKLLRRVKDKTGTDTWCLDEATTAMVEAHLQAADTQARQSKTGRWAISEQNNQQEQ